MTIPLNAGGLHAGRGRGGGGSRRHADYYGTEPWPDKTWLGSDSPRNNADLIQESQVGGCGTCGPFSSMCGRERYGHGSFSGTHLGTSFTKARRTDYYSMPVMFEFSLHAYPRRHLLTVMSTLYMCIATVLMGTMAGLWSMDLVIVIWRSEGGTRFSTFWSGGLMESMS